MAIEIGNVIAGRHINVGTWKVVDGDGAWIKCVGLNEKALVLAVLDPDGVCWFRKQDMLVVQTQEETLF